jgi:hypothetical protein
MMFEDNRAMSRKVGILLLCAAALALGGCETASKLNPFAEKDKILPGERRPVFGPDSGFAGARQLPPPNSDYMGSTMPANQPVQQAGTPAAADGAAQPAPAPAAQ